MPVKKKTKPKAKPRHKFTGKPSFLWAVKAKRSGKGPPPWMPLEVAVNLEGEKTGKLLVICGWSVATSEDDDTWPADRIEANMARIKKEWTADYGRGWKLELRS